VEIDFFAISKFVDGPRVSQCTRTSKVLIRHWHQVSVADTSCGKPPVYSCRRPRESMFLYLRAEQTLSVLGTGVLWCW